MKDKVVFIIAIVLVVALTGCSKSKDTGAKDQKDTKSALEELGEEALDKVIEETVLDQDVHEAVQQLAEKRKNMCSIILTPDFEETELDVNKDYYFTIRTEPDTDEMKEAVKTADIVSDNSNASFEIIEGTSMVMHTVGEGKVTISVKFDDVESNALSFDVVDRTAAAEKIAMEEETAAAKAAADAEAMAEAAAKASGEANESYVRTNDKVRIRKSPSTDSNDNIIDICGIGEVYKRLEVDGEWTKIEYKGEEGYIKTEFVDPISEEEAKKGLK